MSASKSIILAVLLILFAVLSTPAQADDWSYSWQNGYSNWLSSWSMTSWLSKFTDWINPTNIAIVDPDLDCAAMISQPAAGQIEAASAHAHATGSGVVVAVLDGGFNTAHPILDGQVSGLAWDALDQDSDPNDGGNGIDDDGDGLTDLAAGHGTFVSGMVLMAAPEATILPIRVVNDEGYGTIAALVRGLKYAIDNDADVINLSVEAGVGGSFAVRWQLLRAKNRGIPVIASAGNSGLDDLLYLAADKRTIAVGAVTIDDELADFSNGGGAELLDLYAPGVDLIGPLGYPQGDSMGWWSGTSFSAGIVSGAAALALELDPLATVDEVRTLLEASVDPVDDVFHTGRINLRKVTE